jgi:hypothetical protein
LGKGLVHRNILVISVRRTKKGQRAAIKIDEIKGICYIAIDKNGLAMEIITDDDYPEKVAFLII